MAKKLKVTEVVVSLRAPGMTPMLKAGAGGLATALRSIALRRDPHAPWPTTVSLGPGAATVSRDAVTITWPGDSAPEKVFEALFGEVFTLREPLGLIEILGTFPVNRPASPAVLDVAQRALRRTFLQHGGSAKKRSARSTFTFEVDGRQVPVEADSYDDFAHRGAHSDVVQALASGAVELPGWAYPGAAQKHERFTDTKFRYGAAEAIAAVFSIVGTLSFLTPNRGEGVLVIPEPTDLLRFAEARPALAPACVEEGYVSGNGEASLRVQLALRTAHFQRRASVARTFAVTLQTLPWATQQKTRASTGAVGEVDDATLDLFEAVVRELPNSVRVRPAERPAERGKRSPAKGEAAPTAGDGGEGDGASGYFVTSSALRGFLCENISASRSWFEGFATATAGEKPPRFIHYYRAPDNLGALYGDERKGLITMVEKLDDAQRILVRSIHVAIRQRFGAIASESKDNPVARENRWDNERERIRLAFAGTKTHEQVRASLADLWSRAGPNSELRAQWELVLPMLAPSRWQEARDLALVALASYGGEGARRDGDANGGGKGSSE